MTASATLCRRPFCAEFLEDTDSRIQNDNDQDRYGIARVAAPAYAGHTGQPLDLTPQNRAAARDWLDPHYSFVADYTGRLPPSRATAERQTT